MVMSHSAEIVLTNIKQNFLSLSVSLSLSRETTSVVCRTATARCACLRAVAGRSTARHCACVKWAASVRHMSVAQDASSLPRK